MNINEQLTRMKNMMGLNEALTDTVYHFTSVNRLYNILKTNQFITTSAVAVSSDMAINKGKFFFFSTTRSKSTGYTQGNVKLVLNGRKLSQRYKGVAVDYWQYSKNRDDYASDEDYKNSLANAEQEDRIVTNEPTISNATSYIMEIHIMIGKYDRIKKDVLDYIIGVSKNLNIPIYFYDSWRQNWLLQNKSGLVDPYQAYHEITDDKTDDGYKTTPEKELKYNYMRPLILFSFNDKGNYDKTISLIGSEFESRFKEEYDEEVYKYLQKNAVYDYEAVTLYRNYIQNIRANPDTMARNILKLLSDDMRKLGVNNIKNYIEVKQNKTAL